MKWTPRRLDQLGHVSRGRSRHRPRDAAHLYGGIYPFIQTGDVKHAGLYITEHKNTYSQAGLEQSKLWPSGTLCITIAANIAETSILGFDACFPDSIIGFIADPNKADTRFVKYLFDASLKSRYKKFTQGAAQDNLSQEKLLSLEFIVPSVDEQEEIANIISSYDDLIEFNIRQIQLLEDAARQLYKEWFVRLRFKGHEQVNEVDGLPEGWVRKTAYDAIEVLSGGTPKTSVPDYWNGEIPFFTPKDANNRAYASKTEKYITKLGLTKCNSRLYPKDTLFITARGTVGNLNLANVPMAMNQSCYALVAREPLNQFFLYLSLQSAIQEFKSRAVGAVFNSIVVDTFKETLINSGFRAKKPCNALMQLDGRGGSRFNQRLLKSIPFVIPSESLVDQFTEMVEPLFQQTLILATQNDKLRQARDLLLPRLMSGEIRV